MQIRLNKLDFTELYFSGNKVDALQGIFNGQPGSYKPRRLFCIQFALCLHTYKSKIKGWRADGGALSLPSYCWFSCCVVWRRLGVGSAPARKSTAYLFDPHLSIHLQLSCAFVILSIDNRRVYSFFDFSTYDVWIRYSIARQSTHVFVFQFLDSRHVRSLLDWLTVDLFIRYSVARQSTCEFDIRSLDSKHFMCLRYSISGQSTICIIYLIHKTI